MKNRALIILLAVVIVVIMFLSLADIIESSWGMTLSLLLFIIFDVIMARLAKLNDVKIIEYLMIGFALIGTVLFSVNLIMRIKTAQVENYKFQVVVTPSKSDKKFLFSHGGHDYYTFNLSDVGVIIGANDERKDLQSALESGQITLEEILDLAIPNSNTVGYKIYYDGGQSRYKNDEYSIVVCEDEKESIIFSTYDYEYIDGICN